MKNKILKITLGIGVVIAVGFGTFYYFNGSPFGGSTAKSSEFRVIVTGKAYSSLEACGCKDLGNGGIRARSTKINELRDQAKHSIVGLTDNHFSP